MNQPEQRFNVNTRVKLRGDVDPSFYDGCSRTGNEGWIRKHKRDKYGYPQVFIQWDKDHWAYNGQEDGWTWEGQFEAAVEDMMAEIPEQPNSVQDQVRGITEQSLSSMLESLGQLEAEEVAVEDDEVEEWQSLASQAAEAIVNSPGYVVVALEYDKNATDSPIIIPRIFHASRHASYALIVQSQLGHLLASLQDATIGDILDQESKGDR